jgi:hypothetical protein
VPERPPEHWSLLAGPANWFQMRYPPQWEAEERQGAYALRPADADALVAVNTIWLEEDRSDVLPSLSDVVAQFPQVREVSHVSDEPVEEVVECMQGDAMLGPSASWWRRLWKTGHWRSWKMWAFRRSHLLVIVTLLHEEQRDPELESIVRMMLRCLELPDEPADPPEVFAQKALQLARAKFPLLDIELVEEFQIQIDSSRLNLANFYRAYVRDPDNFEQILLPALATAVQVQGWGDEETAPPLEIVRDRLMPMLYPEDAWQEKLPEIIGEPWVAGLVILYVVDESNAYWYVREELLEKWSLSQNDLHEIAMDNLHSYFETQPMEMAVAADEEGSPSMMMPGKPDTYNSVRLLSHSFLERMREVAEGDLAIGVPGRDFFVAVSMKLPQMVDQIRKRVREDFLQTDHPLTDRMLLVTADGVSELIDDDEG